MAINNFIPEIWSAKILTTFQEQAIFAGLANREYEGELTPGANITIPGVVDVQVHDYAAGRLKDEGGDLIPRTTSADDISDTGIQLLVDQEKNFDFQVDDIDRVQAKGNLGAYTQSAANGLTQDSDQYLAERLILEGTAATVGAPATNGDSAWNVIRDIRKGLGKAKVPQANRVLVANAEFAALLMDAQSKFTKANESGTNAGIREATIGRTLGFNVYESENLPETNKPQVVAWYTPALAYVSQVNKTEAMRAQNSFADRVRGLHVYGAKVLRPTAVMHWTAA